MSIPRAFSGVGAWGEFARKHRDAMPTKCSLLEMAEHVVGGSPPGGETELSEVELCRWDTLPRVCIWVVRSES